MLKLEPSKAVQLESVTLVEFTVNMDKDMPYIPIKDNLSIHCIPLQGVDNKGRYAVELHVKTRKKSRFNFSVSALFEFTATKENLVSTMIMISYSTLRGILLERLPQEVGFEYRMLPCIDASTLMKVCEHSVKHSSR